MKDKGAWIIITACIAAVCIMNLGVYGLYKLRDQYTDPCAKFAMEYVGHGLCSDQEGRTFSLNKLIERK